MIEPAFLCHFYVIFGSFSTWIFHVIFVSFWLDWNRFITFFGCYRHVFVGRSRLNSNHPNNSTRIISIRMNSNWINANRIIQEMANKTAERESMARREKERRQRCLIWLNRSFQFRSSRPQIRWIDAGNFNIKQLPPHSNSPLRSHQL